MDTLVIELDPPIRHEGGTCDRLTLREPTYAEVRMAEALMKAIPPEPAQERAYQQKLVATVAQVAPGVVAELPASKLVRAARYLDGFILGELPARDDGDDAPAAAEASFLPPDGLTIELDPPIVQQGVTYDALPLREPTARQLEQAEMKIKALRSFADTRDYQLALVQGVSGLPPSVVRALPIRTFREAVRYLEGFLAPAPATGAS